MKTVDDLKDLSNPLKIKTNIKLLGFSKEFAHEILNTMVIIRETERKLAFGKQQGLIGGPIHLSVGQEAAAAGVAAFLKPSDRVFGAHRSHAHLLSMDMAPKALFAEVLGRTTGLSKGMGGSMHLWSQPKGFFGSVPIVSGTVPLAVGAGLAAKFQKTDDIAVAFLGDGAMEEGIVHESLNLARLKQIPVLFVVENNMFASHMHISMRQPNTSTTRFAKANEIPSMLVDGNDISAITKASKHFIEKARSGHGPGFLELVTYRWYGHVDWREDIDVGVNRSSEDLENWKKLDPIKRLKDAMIEKKWLSENEFEKLRNSVLAKIEKDWQLALNDPHPQKEALLSSVYQGGHPSE